MRPSLYLRLSTKESFEAFQQGLRTRNQKTPQIVIENMASVFAQSGKMNLNQARDSYDFTVPSMKCFGLFAPTHFKPRPPFDGNDSNVYHIIHGTANKGASAILAGELIRPGDFTMRQDPLQCGYPSYGFYSAGEVAAKTIEFSYNIAGTFEKDFEDWQRHPPSANYTGRHAHNNQLAGGNEEVQRLCGEHAVARGKEKRTVARSENTTVFGVILYYKNQVTLPGQSSSAVPSSGREKPSEPPYNKNR